MGRAHRRSVIAKLDLALASRHDPALLMSLKEIAFL